MSDVFDPQKAFGKINLDEELVTKALNAAQDILKNAGIDDRAFISAIEVSEYPNLVEGSDAARDCGYRRVCDRSEQVCDWYTDAQGNRWRRCYTRPVCRMVPNC